MTDTSKEQIDHLLGFLDSDKKVLCHNAAAVIRALVERAEKAEAERDVTRKELGLKHDEANRYVNELLDTKTRVKVLEEALQPFGSLARQLDDHNPSPLHDESSAPTAGDFSMFDLRRARAALENKT
jgi:hypothetical protein